MDQDIRQAERSYLATGDAIELEAWARAAGRADALDSFRAALEGAKAWTELARYFWRRELVATRDEVMLRRSIYSSINDAPFVSNGAGMLAGDIFLQASRMLKVTRRWRVVSLSPKGGRFEALCVSENSAKRSHGDREGRVLSGNVIQAKWLGVLSEPFDPRRRRELAAPKKGASFLRVTERVLVVEALERTWCLGATEQETRDYVSEHATWQAADARERQAVWAETRDLTGWAVTRGQRRQPKPEPEPQDEPQQKLFGAPR